MRRHHGNRARLGGILLAALGVAAMLALPGFAAAKDRNHDRIPDRWEKRHHLSLKVNQAARDQDRDHLRNRGEFQADDNPRNRDSDGDDVMDGDENAGTIQSFDPATGKLVIALFGGETASGVVTDQTRIRCGHECGHEHGDDSSEASASRHGDDEDNSGPGNSGDEDNSGPGNSGDDQAGPATGSPGQGDDGNDDPPDCTTAALVVGATVEEAEIELKNGVATFEEIELEDREDDSPSS